MTQKELDDYKKSIETKTLKELQDIEGDFQKELDSIDKEVNETRYKVPSKDFKTIGSTIAKFLDKQTVQWNMTGAMVALSDFWKSEKTPKEIAYAMVDATLRMLGETQYTGYEEWAGIIAVNKWFDPIKEDYGKLVQKIYDTSTKHSCILDELQKKIPIGDPNIGKAEEITEK